MKLADATDPRFTDGQRAHLARFEAAEVPAEVALYKALLTTAEDLGLRDPYRFAPPVVP